MNTLRSVAPSPTLSLQSRLRFILEETLSQLESKTSMKTVDTLSKRFDLIFTGDVGQDWMNHVNELERQEASRHQWLSRQFYFALSSTLSGRAKETLSRLEKGLEVPRIQDFIPSWFSPSNEEWHAIVRGTCQFSDFPFRTRIVIILYYFQHKFQANTAHEVWDRFTYSMQSVHESLQDWGCRLKVYSKEVTQYGIQVTWQQYIRQWLVGTQNKSFVRLLRKAMRPDRHGPAVVYDLDTFTAWYQLYEADSLDSKRLSQEQSRLFTLNRARRVSVKQQHQNARRTRDGTKSNPSRTPANSYSFYP